MIGRSAIPSEFRDLARWLGRRLPVGVRHAIRQGLARPASATPPAISVGGKLANIGDLLDPHFGAAFRGRFPDGNVPLLPRKNWELSWIADRLGEMNLKGGSVLGLGVGDEPLIYHVAHLAQKVVATDLFSMGTAWREARHAVESVYDASPFPYPRERLQVRNMDMRQIDFPAESFDAIWSCSSVEHVQTIPQFVQIFREVHRTLKPGGVAVITTEYSLGEPYFLPGVLSLWRDCSLFTDCLDGLTLIGSADLTYHCELPGNLPTRRCDVNRLAMHRDYMSGGCGFCIHVGYTQTIPVALTFRKTGPDFNWPELLGAPAWYEPFAAGIETFQRQGHDAAVDQFHQALALAKMPGARLHCFRMLIEAQVHAGQVENLHRTLNECEQEFQSFPSDDDALDLIAFVAAGAGKLPLARRCWESAHSCKSAMPGNRLRIRINQLEAEIRQDGVSTEAHHLNRLAESAWHEAVDFLGGEDVFLKQLEERLEVLRIQSDLPVPARPISVSARVMRDTNSLIDVKRDSAPRTASPLLCYFGHHKCGTTWITTVLSDICTHAGLATRAHADEKDFAGEVEDLRTREPFDFWIYVNAEITFVRSVNLRGFHVVRDPRDVLVSAYFSHMHSHSDENWPRLRHYRPHLRRLSKHDGMLAEMEFNANFFGQMLMWDYQQPDVLEIRFEDLIASPEAGFMKALTFLGIVPKKISLDVTHDIVQSFSFERLSGGRRPGMENQHHHYRMGQPGEWRKHFEPAHIDYFKRLYNPLLIKLGYEKNEDWC